MKIIFEDKIENMIGGATEINSEEIRLIYENNFWDGPLDGMSEWKGEKYYFFSFLLNDENQENKWPRKYILIKLNEQQEEQEKYWNELFKKYVGDHNEYINGKKDISLLKPNSLWHYFYNEFEKSVPSEIEKEQIVGWFQMKN